MANPEKRATCGTQDEVKQHKRKKQDNMCLAPLYGNRVSAFVTFL